MDVGANGGIKFLVQDIDRSVPKRMTLKSFMDGADISQKQLAVMLDVSESTVSRYMTGRVPIPDSHFIKLGIPVDKTIMQRRRQQDKLITVSETLKSKVKELDNIINGLEGLQ
jgi:predicted transcriptional regulator